MCLSEQSSFDFQIDSFQQTIHCIQMIAIFSIIEYNSLFISNASAARIAMHTFTHKYRMARFLTRYTAAPYVVTLIFCRSRIVTACSCPVLSDGIEFSSPQMKCKRSLSALS